ncbi:hypothetical protein HPG69_008797 [Diceros bicornis minor]|uniref:Uncharacterized protein n=1 Tax=Diceros bicornis minor TaxID=77932 RepID=A0A7J7FAS6_DICBM|nr:hypothetical protein HPG69_008797 [Diceros bicornis minor]
MVEKLKKKKGCAHHHHAFINGDYKHYLQKTSFNICDQPSDFLVGNSVLVPSPLFLPLCYHAKLAKGPGKPGLRPQRVLAQQEWNLLMLGECDRLWGRGSHILLPC